MLTGNLIDVHVYSNHVDGLREQIIRSPRPLPEIKFKKWTNFWDWEYSDVFLENYDPHSVIKLPVAI
jgi:thymidylate synthase